MSGQIITCMPEDSIRIVSGATSVQLPVNLILAADEVLRCERIVGSVLSVHDVSSEKEGWFLAESHRDGHTDFGAAPTPWGAIAALAEALRAQATPGVHPHTPEAAPNGASTKM